MAGLCVWNYLDIDFSLLYLNLRGPLMSDKRYTWERLILPGFINIKTAKNRALFSTSSQGQ
jgi:hypothetical protein